MPRLVHDRITWLAYAQLGLWGFFLYGFGPVVPLLRDEQGTTAAVAGLHSTALAAGALAGGALFAPVARQLGRRPTIWLGLAGVAAGVTGLALLRPLPATLTVVMVIATAGTLVVSGVNVVLTTRHGRAAPAALAEANAACAGMGILAPLVIGLSVNAGWGWRPGMAVVVALIALVAVATLTPGVRRPRATATPAPRTRVTVARGARRLPKAYWIAWVLMGVTGSIEVCLSLWTADVLRSHAGMAPGAASAAVAAIVCGMFVGRLFGGRVALRLRPVPLLLAALGVSLAGFTVFWVASAGWLAIVGLVVLGLGNALHYPLAISLALAVAGDATDQAAGWSAYSMGVGFGIAPVALGWVADGVGAHLAFLLLPGFIAVAALLAVRLGRALPAPAPAEQPTPTPV
ncbi:MFS transporter [Micromonospora zingiberis]|uniref:MFS transporter n=1 Tax=Micromonospora zingiberis TaxID=2053011 RepID=A0A4R0GVK3_9ACTN|nr:MFS transporter [Micromonospora zingiberis]TCB99811.1 MFS transporter [Micromonospora zingiberis]